VNTIDRINALFSHFGQQQLRPADLPIGGHDECDALDRLAGIETHGASDYETRYSLNRGHMRPPNYVGERVNRLEAYVFGNPFCPIAPVNLSSKPVKPSVMFWLGEEGHCPIRGCGCRSSW
jgi:hypothetical protein